MAQNVGTLELKEGTGKNGEKVTALMGNVNVAGVIAGGLAIAKNPNLQPGAKMTEIVKLRSAGEWAALGKARFKRSNPKAAWYLEMVLESPLIDAKIGKELWLRGFPVSGNMGDEPDAAQYDLVWGNGKKQAAAGDVIADDEIPF